MCIFIGAWRSLHVLGILWGTFYPPDWCVMKDWIFKILLVPEYMFYFQFKDQFLILYITDLRHLLYILFGICYFYFYFTLLGHWIFTVGFLYISVKTCISWLKILHFPSNVCLSTLMLCPIIWFQSWAGGNWPINNMRLSFSGATHFFVVWKSYTHYSASIYRPGSMRSVSMLIVSRAKCSMSPLQIIFRQIWLIWGLQYYWHIEIYWI